MKNKILLFFVIIIFFPLVVSAEGLDMDNDGLTDQQEQKYYTDPNNPDTDKDGFPDGVEVEQGYSPLVGNKKRIYEVDYDKDGLSDWHEIWFHSDIGKTDTDGDGMDDFSEVMYGRDPIDASTTSTKFYRGYEVNLTTQSLSYIVDKIKILTYPVSTGNPGTPTPPGQYSILRKVPVKRYVGTGYDLKNVKWNMEYKKGGYYIHAAYWHNDFGKRTHSHGCINMREKDVELLYRYTDIGVPVMVTGTTPKRYRVGT